jgi:exodeoxyribonuclease V alpha subunit
MRQKDLFGTENLETVQGEVESLRSRPKDMPADTAWCAGTLVSETHGFVSFIGSINVRVGDSVKLLGNWEDDPKYGHQFRAQFSSPVVDTNSLQKVIERDPRFRSIGPVRSAKIVEFLKARGLELGQVIRDESLTAEMRHHASLTNEGVTVLREFWLPLEREHTTKAALITLGVPLKAVEAIWNDRKENAVEAIKTNPYEPVSGVNGYTLGIADEIGLKKMKLSSVDMRRITCGITLALDKVREEGHTWVTPKTLKDMTTEGRILGIKDLDGRRLVERHIAKLISDGFYETRVVDGDVVICHTDVVRLEERVIAFFSPEAKYQPNPRIKSDALGPNWIADLAKSLSPPDGVVRHPSDEQHRAIESFSKFKTSVITGAAGSGKTFTVSMIVALCRQLKLSVTLAAPTGKAAKRMLELIKKNGVNVEGMIPPQTLHMLLGFDGKKFLAPVINADVLIIDETSMVDIKIMAEVIQRLRPGTALVLVGDHNQLPSIGPGAVLRDVVVNEMANVSRLGTVFRNAGPLRLNAFHVLKGVMRPTTVDMKTGVQTWFVNDRLSNPKDVRDKIVETFTTLLNERGESGLFEIQVLAAMWEIPYVGVDALNEFLRPKAHMVLRGSFDHNENDPDRPIVGDKVMQTRNDYELKLMNGDQGIVVSTDGFFDGKRQGHQDGLVLRVQDGDGWREVNVPKKSIGALAFSYAITAHKCVSPDTLVETPDGLLQIRALKSSGVIGTVGGPRPYKSVVRRPREQMLKITTKSGYSITVTADHGMMVWTGKAYERREARDISIGDFLRLKLGASCAPTLPAKLPRPPEKMDVRTVLHEIPSVLTEDVGEFLGLMVADGTVFNGGFRLGKRHDDVLMRFAYLSESIFRCKTSRVRLDGCDGVEVNSRHIEAWLRSIHGLTPHEKDIPVEIMASPLTVQAAFLRGLFEDGTANVNRAGMLDHIELTTAYESIAVKVQVMLLRFGIISARILRHERGPKRNRDAHYVYIYGENAKRFGSAIGFVSRFKTERLALPTGKETRYVVPVDRRRLKMDTSAGRNSRSRGYVSRYAAGLLGLEDELKFHHEKVSSLEFVESESMCLSVHDGGRFIQNGFDGCNSQGSEWPFVLCSVHSNQSMLNQTLLYTMSTRASQQMFFFGDYKGARASLRRVNEKLRRTLSMPKSDLAIVRTKSTA